MSQNSAINTTTSTVDTKESSAKPGSSTGSLKKQKNKEADEPHQQLTDDFVLMSTPDKFKDKYNNETCAAVKRHRTDPSSPCEKVNLDCLLLADTSLQCAPLHVETLLKQFDNSQPSQAEILFLLVYIVALETGFMCESDYDQTESFLVQLSAICSFHSKNILRLARLKPTYQKSEDKTRFIIKLRTIVEMENANSDQLYGLLIGFVTGDFLIVTLSPANSTGAKGFSTVLSIGRYVLTIQAKNKPLYQRFRKLTELSNLLRDQLFVPMRCLQLSWLQYCIYPCLDSMPAELYDHILQYLNKNQLKILANVNKSLYGLIKTSKFMQPSNAFLDTTVSRALN